MHQSLMIAKLLDDGLKVKNHDETEIIQLTNIFCLHFVLQKQDNILATVINGWINKIVTTQDKKGFVNGFRLKEPVFSVNCYHTKNVFDIQEMFNRDYKGIVKMSTLMTFGFI